MLVKHHDIPDWLYEIAPYGYIAAGLLVIFNVQNVWGIFSALMLSVAGLLVMLMRFQYRREQRQRESAAQAMTVQIDVPEGGSLQLVWDRRYESGNSLLDQQHQRMFALGNALLSAIYSQRTKGEIALALSQLVDEVVHHFQDEELLLESLGYAGIEHHRHVHHGLLDDAHALRHAVESGHLAYKDVLDFYLNKLVVHHILEEDRHYFHKV